MITWDEAIPAIVDLGVSSDRRHVVVTPNIQHIALLERDATLREAYDDAALVLPDGFPVALAVRLQRGRPQERITGADLLVALCGAAVRAGLTVGFIGGRPGAAGRAAARLAADNPGLRIALVSCPPVGFETDARLLDAVLDDVATANPDLLFVGLGAPKQEVWASKYASRLGTGAALCFGAAIDFAGSAARRAPGSVQRLRAEWLWRLIREPRRLTGRYVRSSGVFVRVVGPPTLRALVRRLTGRAPGA